MRWIIIFVLAGLVYWLSTQGYISLESSIEYITTAIRDVVDGIATVLKG